MDIPKSPDVERAVLAQLMNYATAFPQDYKYIEEDLCSGMFYENANNKIYDIMLYLHSEGKPIDKHMVWDEIKRRDLVDQIGGHESFKGILNEWPDGFDRLYGTPGCTGHISQLKEKFLLRQVIELSKIIPVLAITTNAKPSDIFEIIEKRINELREVFHVSRNRNLNDEVRDWVMTTNGTFLTTDVYNGLTIMSREDKKTCVAILCRLKNEKIIESWGDKRGSYRLIDEDCKPIDWENADETVLPIKYPFGIEKWVETMKRNIILVSGEQNAGKTAFLLNIARMNMANFTVHYFSSEMGDSELKKRLRLFDDLLPEHWKVNFYERSSDFQDVIRPDDINIIDFLEIHDEFWKIGGILKSIYDKLNKGIAVIALQKDPEKTFGRGGTMGLEKPRIYLSFKPGECEITKGKNWATEINPNGMKIKYTLFHGAKFKGTDWEFPEPKEHKKRVK